MSLRKVLFKIFLLCVILGGVLVVSWAFFTVQWGAVKWPEILFFIITATFFQLFEIEVTYQRWVSAAVVLFVAAIFVFPDIQKPVIVVFSATVLAETILNVGLLWKKEYGTFFRRASFNVAQLTLVVFIGAMLFKTIGGTQPPWSKAQDFFIALLTFISCNLLNTAFVSAAISLSTGRNFYYPFKFDLQYLPIQVLSLGVLTLLSATVYTFSVWHMALVMVPMGLLHYSLWGYTRLRRSAVEAFEKLMSALRFRDEYTATHSERVARLAVKIARKLGLPEETIERIQAAARIHDIGKVAIPDKVLLKEEGLSDQDWELIKQHPLIGADLISGLEVYKDCVDIVKYEHERWNGSGYPEGLKGEQIPLGARIVAVADVYDALRSDRPYRRAMTLEEAIGELKRMRGKELDPKLVDILLEILEEEKSEEREEAPASKT
jgi:HD-GYP domain-containing protein (c-di-GMP phosphodiesterase class II)